MSSSRSIEFCIIVVYISRSLNSTTISTDHNLIGLLFTLTIRLRYIVVVMILIIHLDLRILLKNLSILIQLKYIIGAIRNIRPCSCTTGSTIDMDILHFSVRGSSIRIKVKPNLINYILFRFQRNHIPVIINIIDPLRNLDLCMLLRITYRLRISLYVIQPSLILIRKRNGDQHRRNRNITGLNVILYHQIHTLSKPRENHISIFIRRISFYLQLHTSHSTGQRLCCRTPVICGSNRIKIDPR